MAILSRLQNLKGVLKTPVRFGGGHAIAQNRPSRWNYEIFKDNMHFYFMLGAVPIAVVVTVANVLQGPAVLKPIPEGYVPKEYEYHKHPLTRWLCKYIFTSYQEKYEAHLSYVWEDTVPFISTI
ncbi:NADH dehydrogenase [ubiquinone] 1 beta subcomplex subunit 5, mitochondrial-like [Eurytemora carolleeae]|uniref:NADH dehydrogenase [ubiquinone] 1 beta subcomplex subunit 5, mitochondrial-like n=1 Tax=Eurytemora carolleeae TaxID=1294199 RepID=UPI000C782E2E|nr:NADH dehydrogenase [ubiquinone] 1 beta subcomplex subunit 5, mitochondrial-like [Eurytemora carolleeae]|eukprot:XP_023338049.1 NADH dehydrogenase [ubiquinone] 1 beta subcomplex subunit 5, mitochondrial-like [Eurytemora affinis]